MSLAPPSPAHSDGTVASSITAIASHGSKGLRALAANPLLLDARTGGAGGGVPSPQSRSVTPARRGGGTTEPNQRSLSRDEAETPEVRRGSGVGRAGPSINRNRGGGTAEGGNGGTRPPVQRYVEEELVDTTPLTSQCSSAGGVGTSSGSRAGDDGGPVDRHTSVSSVGPRYSVISFDLRTKCAAGEEYLVVKNIRQEMRMIAPRCRIQAYKERVSLVDEELFDGVVQIVPMFTMLQVSLERVANWWSLIRLTNSKQFWIATILVNLALFALMLVQQLVPSQRALNSGASVSVCLLTASLLVAHGALVLSLSTQLVLLVLRHFDFWMLQFWVAVTVACHIRYTMSSFHDAEDGRTLMTAAEVTWILVSLESALLLDAFPPLPRRWKGWVYVVMAAFNAYRYLHWFIAVRTDPSSVNVSINFGRFELHLATAGQSAGAALFAYYGRLGARALWKELDLQLIDFPVDMVPHLDEVAQRRMEKERLLQRALRSRGNGSVAAASPLMHDPTGSNPNPAGATGGGGGAATSFSSSSTKSAVSGHGDVGGEDCSPLLGSSPTTRVGNVQLASSSAPLGPSWVADYVGTAAPQQRTYHRQSESALQWSQAAGVWLHVQGSLPCLPSRVEETCQRLQAAAMGNVGGRIAIAVVEDSNVFDCDRRTFEPNCLMQSFSPKPLVAIPTVFRGMSTVYWTRLAMVCVMLGSVIQFLVNAFDKSNFVLMSAVQSFLFAIAALELCCGVSVDMVKYVARTLDFWYVTLVFASQIVSGVVIYNSSYNVALAVIHSCMVVGTSFFVCTIDCIVLTTFTGTVKGVIALTLAVYCLVDLVYVTPNTIHNNPSEYNRTLELYVTVISPGSIAILANMACFLVFVRVAGRTLWMKSRVVFLQYGAKEELVTESDVALMASGGFTSARAVTTSMVTAAGGGGGVHGGGSQRSYGATPYQSIHGSPHAGAGGTSRGGDPNSSSAFAPSKVSFFAGSLGDHDAGRLSATHWRATMIANNAKFVNPAASTSDETPESSSRFLGSKETGSGSPEPFEK